MHGTLWSKISIVSQKRSTQSYTCSNCRAGSQEVSVSRKCCCHVLDLVGRVAGVVRGASHVEMLFEKALVSVCGP